MPRRKCGFEIGGMSGVRRDDAAGAAEEEGKGKEAEWQRSKDMLSNAQEQQSYFSSTSFQYL